MEQLTPAEELAESIIKRRTDALSLKISRYHRKNTILSDLHDCDRYLCYAVLDWDKRPLHDADLQARFDAGSVIEKQTVVELLSLGFEFQSSQTPITIKNRAGETIGTGKIDGIIIWNGRRISCEIKSMHPSVFSQINGADDFQKKPYLRKYTRQLLLYLYGNGEEFGVFIITNGLGAWKILPLTLDLAECEKQLQRMETVHELIKKKEYAPRISYDHSLCGKCPFSTSCLPDIVNRAAEMINNEALESDIARHEELKPIQSEYKRLHDKIKDTFKGIDKAIVGTRFMVMNIPGKRMAYDEIPEDVEEQITGLEKQIIDLIKPFGKRLNTLVIEDLNKKPGEDND